MPKRVSLDAIHADLEALAPYARSFADELGSVYAYFEGRHGGGTLLVWAPRALAPELLRRLPSDHRGRIVVGLDASEGDAWPFARALDWASPQAVLLAYEGEGFYHAGGGWKEVGSPEQPRRVPLEDPDEPLELVRTAPTGVRYRELRAYPAWSSPSLDGSRPGDGVAPQAHLARARGLRVYAAGLLDLDQAWTPLLERLGNAPD